MLHGSFWLFVTRYAYQAGHTAPCAAYLRVAKLQMQKVRKNFRDMQIPPEAQVVIDTSGLNVHQLGRKLTPLLGAEGGPSLRLALMSFGFKYGVPLDADFVFDMRFLPNPFWVPELKALTGVDAPVAEWVMDQDGAQEFVDAVVQLMGPVTAGYLAEGRRYATIGIGCTGGKHRSVAMTQAIAARLTTDRVATFVVHRDLGRE